MCAFEILHYLPIALIAFAVISLSYTSKKAYVSMSVAIMSLIGLIAGEHMHTTHMEPATLFDPCYGYVASLIVSTVALIRNFKVTKEVSAR